MFFYRGMSNNLVCKVSGVVIFVVQGKAYYQIMEVENVLWELNLEETLAATFAN